MTLTPLSNLFLDMEKDKRYLLRQIASIERSASAIFKQHLDSVEGSLRHKAKLLKVSPGYLCDVANGKKAITAKIVKRLDKLK